MTKTLSDIYVGVKKNDKKRHKNDLYSTPPLATYILDQLIDVPTNIIEPCSGRGHISKELIRNGHNVKSYDLNRADNSFIDDITYHQDYLLLNKQNDYDAIITNPPYYKNLPIKMLRKSIEEYDFTAFLLRLTFLEGKSRKLFFQKNPPTDIIFFSDRIKFTTVDHYPVEKNDQIGGMIAYAWFVWDKQKTETKLHWATMQEYYENWREEYERS